jgi:hypothetical protein
MYNDLWPTRQKIAYYRDLVPINSAAFRQASEYLCRQHMKYCNEDIDVLQSLICTFNRWEQRHGTVRR